MSPVRRDGAGGELTGWLVGSGILLVQLGAVIPGMLAGLLLVLVLALPLIAIAAVAGLAVAVAIAAWRLAAALASALPHARRASNVRRGPGSTHARRDRRAPGRVAPSHHPRAPGAH